jgi:hypothetical protein
MLVTSEWHQHAVMHFHLNDWHQILPSNCFVLIAMLVHKVTHTGVPNPSIELYLMIQHTMVFMSQEKLCDNFDIKAHMATGILLMYNYCVLNKKTRQTCSHAK